MESIRDIRRKIGAVKKIKQITRAMNMVAASRLRKTRGKLSELEPYSSRFQEVFGRLYGNIEPCVHPLLGGTGEPKKVELAVFTADRGLCGGFNTSLISTAQNWIEKKKKEGIEYGLTLIGKKGKDYFTRKNYNITHAHSEVYGDADIALAVQMGRRFLNNCINGWTDEVYILYAHFESVARQTPLMAKLIPLDLPGDKGDKPEKGGEYLYEPSSEGLIGEFIPQYVKLAIYDAFLQNQASEHAARMVAMDNATRNCDDMIDSLTLTYNKLRQSAITEELMDIIGGAEAARK